MSKVIERTGFGWNYFILGIILILVSLVAFLSPVGNLFSIAMLFGIVAVMSGIWHIANRRGSMLALLMGILEILIGILLIVNLPATAAFVPYLFAAWFVAYSLFNLFLLGYYKTFGIGHFWLALIVSIIGVVLGVFLLFEPIVSTLTLSLLLGLFFLLAGIESLIIAFSRPTEIVEYDYLPPDRIERQLPDSVEVDRKIEHV